LESLKEKLLKSGGMGGEMLCTIGLTDVTTARKVLASRLEAVLWAGDSFICHIIFSKIANLDKDGIYTSSQTNAFIRHEMPEIREIKSGNN
jgi:hypothetical protein